MLHGHCFFIFNDRVLSLHGVTSQFRLPRKAGFESSRIIMLAFILPLACKRIDSHTRVRSVSVRPMFSSSCFKTPFPRLSHSFLPFAFCVMQSDPKQSGVQPSSDEDTPSVDAVSSTSTTGFVVVEEESKASERSAAWGDTIMHVMLTALAITVSLQARRRVAATLLACLSVPQLLRLGHRLKLVPPSLFPLLPPPGAQATAKRALPAATEPVISVSSVSESHISSIETAVESLKETVSSRDIALATTLATLDSNLAAVRDAVRALAPAATPSASFAHLAEVQVLRARLVRAEEARDAVQARLAASETARAESDHSSRSANLSLDEARHTIADLRTRLASADVRLARLPDIERRLDDALSHSDSLLEQVRDLTRKCEELTYACKDAERRADRGDTIVDVLRSKIDEMTGVRRRSTEASMSTSAEMQTIDEGTGQMNGWQKKLARTVAGLTSESAVLDEMKAMGESAGLADWPVGALSGGEREAPSRADGLPPDGGFAGGAIVSRGEEAARLSSGQNEGAFSFSRNEFEMQRSKQATDLQPSQLSADVPPKTSIITPPPDNTTFNGNGFVSGSSEIDDASRGVESESINEHSVDEPLLKEVQVPAIESGNDPALESSSFSGAVESSENSKPTVERDEGREMASAKNETKRQLSYLEQLEQQPQNPVNSAELVDDKSDTVTGSADEVGNPVKDGCNEKAHEKGAVPADESTTNDPNRIGNAGFTMERPCTSVEIKPGVEVMDNNTEANSSEQHEPSEQQHRKYELENNAEQNGDLLGEGGTQDERNESTGLKGGGQDCDRQTQSVDEASAEEDVGEWRSVSGESEYPFHEHMTDNEEDSKSAEEVMKDAETLIRHGRRRGLALADADRIFRQAYTRLENLLERIDNNDPDRSRVEGSLGSCLVSWVKVNIADAEARPRLERAISLLERRIEKVGDDATALFNAGLCLCLFAATGNIEDAREYYERACGFYEQLLKMEPQSRIGFFNCGLAYISLGRIAVSAGDDAEFCKEIMGKAIARFEKSLELKPGDGKALSYLEESRKQLVSLQE